jgi:hypothetical protein
MRAAPFDNWRDGATVAPFETRAAEILLLCEQEADRSGRLTTPVVQAAQRRDPEVDITGIRTPAGGRAAWAALVAGRQARIRRSSRGNGCAGHR